jgi:hypothetical protein
MTKMRESKPPIKPKVDNEIDTQNFDDFEEFPEKEANTATTAPKELEVPVKESFIGYTFKRYDNKSPKLTDMFQ